MGLLRSSLFLWSAGIALGIGLMIGCSADPDSNSLLGSKPAKTGTSDGGAATTESSTGPFGDDEALAYLTSACSACHGIDANGVPAVNASQWAMPKELTRAWLESTADTADVYQTLLLASQKKATGFPVSMPPAAVADDAERAKVDRMLQWMRITQPLAVLNANEIYGNPGDSTVPNITFACAKNATLRRFLSNFTLAAYQRAPTPDELASFPAGDLDLDVKADARKSIVAQLDEPAHRDEFVAHGLELLATAIGGAPDVSPNGDDITPEVGDELATEFYALLQDRWTTAEYSSLFHDDTVMVTANTAPLYGCTAPDSTATHVACTMTAPRHSFFSTLGFLNSKQSSFLITNNNYGRVAFMYFTLFGDIPRAATSGPSGSTAATLPSCLETTDERSLVGAKFGTHAIPEVGAFCQGCHLYKGLAAGSILFRPFTTRGMIYDPSLILQNIGGAGDDDFILKNALLADQKAADGTTSPVDLTFLAGLASNALNQPQSCLPTSDPAKPFATFNHVGELADFLLNRKVSLATGFTKHAHRAFANSSTPSAEMILKVYSAIQNKGTLHDLAMAYFNSDSFACDGAP